MKHTEHYYIMFLIRFKGVPSKSCKYCKHLLVTILIYEIAMDQFPPPCYMVTNEIFQWMYLVCVRVCGVCVCVCVCVCVWCVWCVWCVCGVCGVCVCVVCVCVCGVCGVCVCVCVCVVCVWCVRCVCGVCVCVGCVCVCVVCGVCVVCAVCVWGGSGWEEVGKDTVVVVHGETYSF